MENAVGAFKTGLVFDYLLKPLEDIGEIDAVVSRAVERHQLRSQNAILVAELHAHVEELEAAKQQLLYQAERDGLTGLLNHKTIHKKLFDLLNGNPTEPVSVIMMDLDGFKLINDTYGHPVGDQVLRHLSMALEEVCPSRALLGRFGGDEFIVAIPYMTAQGALVIAAEIKEYLAEYPFVASDGSRLPLRLCAGIADTSGAEHSAAYLVIAADSALYEGKNHGGDQVTLHMSHARNDGDSDFAKFDVLDSLVTMIDNKDHYTRRHSEAVTEYALQLVGALGFSCETLHAVQVAGLLHDIGKIGVPDFILRKPGKLTPDEYEVMKGHVTISRLIIHGLPRLNDILDAVSYHHERWDGTGYPSGAAGTDIPILGRVMAIADAFSAMTMDRPYRSAMCFEEAVAEIERGAGTQFDPEFAHLFIATMRASKDAERKAA
jgi:diguanylate cyclase (GGDEF)-like protein